VFKGGNTKMCLSQGLPSLLTIEYATHGSQAIQTLLIIRSSIQPNIAMPADMGSGSTGTGKGGNGFTVVAHALAKAGIKNVYGVIGIPVTELASAAQVTCGLPNSTLVVGYGKAKVLNGRFPYDRTGQGRRKRCLCVLLFLIRVRFTS
jgi:hypothetical protein